MSEKIIVGINGNITVDFTLSKSRLYKVFNKLMSRRAHTKYIYCTFTDERNPYTVQ